MCGFLMFLGSCMEPDRTIVLNNPHNIRGVVSYKRKPKMRWSLLILSGLPRASGMTWIR